MAVIIPIVPGEPEQILDVALDGVAYVLRVRLNTTDDDGAGAWYLDAWERDGKTPIAFGVKLVLGVELGKTYDHPLFQAGLFLVEDGDAGTDPRLGDLGARVHLVHFTTADAVLSEVDPP